MFVLYKQYSNHSYYYTCTLYLRTSLNKRESNINRMAACAHFFEQALGLTSNGVSEMYHIQADSPVEDCIHS
jgi:hypothetical protein